jgi:hypothetical protein
VFCVLVFALPVWSRAGRADPGEPARQERAACLSWAGTARSDCPTAEQTEAAVEAILGHRAFPAGACSIKMTGRTRALEGGGWQADLSFAKSDGEALGDRSLQSRTWRCAALKDPVALVIALMVEAGESEATLQLPAPMPPPESSSEPAVTMGAGASVSSGLLPNTGFGATVDFGWMVGRWLPLRFASTYWFPDSAGRAGYGGQFWAWTGGAGVCPTLVSSTVVEGTLCADVQAGIIHGTGVGLPNAGSPTKPYGEAEVHVRLSFPLWSSLQAFVQLGAAVPWLRPRFVYLDVGEPVYVHRPEALVWSGGVGVALRASGRARASTTSQ